MKAHKGSYVNKTNEKPVLKAEGGNGGKGTARVLLLFVKSCSIYSHHWGGELCCHGGITKHLLMARKTTTPSISLTAQ